jgi:hypothetical protein
MYTHKNTPRTIKNNIKTIKYQKKNYKNHREPTEKPCRTIENQEDSLGTWKNTEEPPST